MNLQLGKNGYNNSVLMYNELQICFMRIRKYESHTKHPIAAFQGISDKSGFPKSIICYTSIFL